MASGPEVSRDRWSAAGLAAVAVAYLAAGRRYPLDTLTAPGPGVFPLAAGLALLAAAAWQFAGAGRQLPTAPPPAAERIAPLPRRSALPLAAAIAGYAAVLPVLGFAPASFALVVVAARLIGLPGWWRPLALAAGVAAATRLVFVTWLGVALP
jgi:hypothetical protein